MLYIFCYITFFYYLCITKSNKKLLKIKIIMKNEIETTRAMSILNRASKLGFEIVETQQFDEVVVNAAEFLIDIIGSDIQELTTIENNSIIYCDENGWEFNCSGEFYTNEDEKKNAGKKFTIQTLVNSKGEVVELYVEFFVSDDIVNAVDVALRYSYLYYGNRLSNITNIVKIPNSIQNRIIEIMNDYDREYEELPRDVEAGVPNELDQQITKKYIEKIIDLIK